MRATYAGCRGHLGEAELDFVRGLSSRVKKRDRSWVHYHEAMSQTRSIPTPHRPMAVLRSYCVGSGMSGWQGAADIDFGRAEIHARDMIADLMRN